MSQSLPNLRVWVILGCAQAPLGDSSFGTGLTIEEWGEVAPGDVGTQPKAGLGGPGGLF